MTAEKGIDEFGKRFYRSIVLTLAFFFSWVILSELDLLNPLTFVFLSAFFIFAVFRVYRISPLSLRRQTAKEGNLSKRQLEDYRDNQIASE